MSSGYAIQLGRVPKAQRLGYGSEGQRNSFGFFSEAGRLAINGAPVAKRLRSMLSSIVHVDIWSRPSDIQPGAANWSLSVQDSEGEVSDSSSGQSTEMSGLPDDPDHEPDEPESDPQPQEAADTFGGGIPPVPDSELNDTSWYGTAPKRSRPMKLPNIPVPAEGPMTPAPQRSVPQPSAPKAAPSVRKNVIPPVPPLDDSNQYAASGPRHGTKHRQEERAERQAQESRLKSFRVAAALGTDKTAEIFPSGAEMYQALAHRIRLSPEETEEIVQFMKESGLATMSATEEHGVQLSLSKQCIALRTELLARLAARKQQ
jgi:hypothetical protein